MIDRSDPLWFKDAVIYELHVKAFRDANGDGVGDFAGLIERLDYIHDLGVTAVWLLPFYPSPLRDDGYDIADYRAINPAYGDMRDFRRFVAEAHRRDIRVITELVVNHTSDQHPWFQRARKARRGSSARDFYVWSDTDQKYPGTRIIFTDTETSNWTWDPVAEAFYWHRFYSHQPDLNYDNPRVLEEVIKAMDFWLEAGVDGLRLDAVPYLVEREGTGNENLPETHAVLKRIRARLDVRFPDRMLLAEANQWPEDTAPYFGDGDECHMAFHFPLMPRIYMALAQEDRHPITDIIAQTPEIPDTCQWAIFLRNHDELTLEMVTDSERDYLWNTYAFDTRSRINMGIRRRLAPLLDNDRRKIELLNGLLLSMPGTPVIYYGDEIGMGDNYYLGDRDGVRTPMQWSADRNGGFSRADPQRLFLPPIMDPIYGYEAVNVESQQTDTSSILNWTRRTIAVRKTSAAFGRGKMTFLYPRNRKILAYLRRHGNDDILCVFNLSRAAQAVELDLAAFKGRVPVEMTGRSAFPPVGELPYLLTLPAYGFFWFALTTEAEAPAWHEPAPEPLPELQTLVLTHGWRTVTEGQGAATLEREALPAYLANQRWCAAGNARIAGVRLEPWCELTGPGGTSYLLAAADVTGGDGRPRRYFFPLAFLWGEEHLRAGAAHFSCTLARIRRGPRLGALIDAAAEADLALALLERLRASPGEARIDGIKFEGTGRLAAMTLPERPDMRRPTIELSNVSVMLGDEVVLKLYRRLQAGIQPEIEVSRFLAGAGFANTAPFLGAVEHVDGDGARTAIAAAFGFMVNQGSAWTVLVDGLDRQIEARELAPHDAAPAMAASEMATELARVLGRRTAEMHCAFASGTGDPAFAPERVQGSDLKRWSRAAGAAAKQAFAALRRARRDKAADADLAGAVEAALGRQDDIERAIAALAAEAPSGMKMRHHGDFRLQQALVVHNDVCVIDFEGEPERSLEERRAKADPARDVAGLLRSIDEAAWTAIQRAVERGVAGREAVEPLARAWRDAVQSAFLDAYDGALADCAHWPMTPRETRARRDLFLIEKALRTLADAAAGRSTPGAPASRAALAFLAASGAGS